MSNMAEDVSRSIGRLEGKMDSLIVAVGSLQGAFDTMEKGRLSVLEVKFATLHTEVTTKAKSSAALWAVAASVVSSFVAAILAKTFL